MKIGGGNGEGVYYCHFIIISDVNAIKCFSDFFCCKKLEIHFESRLIVSIYCFLTVAVVGRVTQFLLL